MGEPELVRSQEKVSLSGYLKEMLTVVREQLAEENKSNRELEAYYLVTEIQWGRKSIADLTKEEAASIILFMLEKMRAIDRRQILMEGSVTSSCTIGGGPGEKHAGDGSD